MQNANGDSFEPDDEISVSCDRRLTIHLGPSQETPFLLDNWEFRPPGNCGERTQCGFIQLQLSYADTDIMVNRASLSIVLEAELVSDQLEQVTARLIDGRNGNVFLFEDREVAVGFEPDLTFEQCPRPGGGGMGGGTSPDSGGMGGAGAAELGGLGGTDN